ncbi:putative DNA-binding domain-containing protein [Nitratireductor kimnyeongensis]|uniref:DNA-binding domain-containing protein n=1 Tax=Nitratireductor kimnyeongensis TaxID=430679 RepID=A0ABW0T9B3_9HYPH|nr:DNA-binding domain-containing protein [Nitratireductor kimnyeongensis]QZZ36301.1 DNA-binding domain-containing protein [Nitratireductor kimnyeongensis]
MSSNPEMAVERKPATFDVAFGSVLLDPECATPQGVSGPHGKAANKRFNVYRNNVTHSLVTALTEIFPTVMQILGADNFRMIARDFIRARPPRSRLVFEYGRDFAAFLADYQPIRHLQYLPDVARLERAWLDAFHAADQAPLAAEDLSALPPEALADAVFVPHPATRLISSIYAVHTIFTAHRQGPMPERINAGIAEAALVTRPGLEVQVRGIDHGQFLFVDALSRGVPLQRAAGRSIEAEPDFDFPAAIALTIESGAFAGCRASNESDEKD